MVFVADWIIFHSLLSQLALGIESLLLKHDSLLWLPPPPSHSISRTWQPCPIQTCVLLPFIVGHKWMVRLSPLEASLTHKGLNHVSRYKSNPLQTDVLTPKTAKAKVSKHQESLLWNKGALTNVCQCNQRWVHTLQAQFNKYCYIWPFKKHNRYIPDFELAYWAFDVFSNFFQFLHEYWKSIVSTNVNSKYFMETVKLQLNGKKIIIHVWWFFKGLFFCCNTQGFWMPIGTFEHLTLNIGQWLVIYKVLFFLFWTFEFKTCKFYKVKKRVGQHTNIYISL